MKDIRTQCVIVFTVLVSLFLTNPGVLFSQMPYAASCIKPSIQRILPHDPHAFTQGLVFRDSMLIESTGLYGQSTLRIIDPQTGNLKQCISVQGVFAEGIALFDTLLTQITWKEQKAFQYGCQSLKKLKTLTYTGEGWGLTSTRSNYVMSNGSDTLYWRDINFAVVRKQAIRHTGKPLKNLNELEYCNGFVYANVWYCDSIFEIDPRAGVVSRIIDCTDLVTKIESMGNHDVLNGIAYSQHSSTFFLTGKNWPCLFEVTIPSIQ